MLRQRTRDQDAQTLKGKERDIGLFEVIWGDAEDELTHQQQQQQQEYEQQQQQQQ